MPVYDEEYRSGELVSTLGVRLIPKRCNCSWSDIRVLLIVDAYIVALLYCVLGGHLAVFFLNGWRCGACGTSLLWHIMKCNTRWYVGTNYAGVLPTSI